MNKTRELKAGGWKRRKTATMSAYIQYDLSKPMPPYIWEAPTHEGYNSIDDAYEEFKREKPPLSLRADPIARKVQAGGESGLFDLGLLNAVYRGMIGICNETWLLVFRDGTPATAERDVHEESPEYHIQMEADDE